MTGRKLGSDAAEQAVNLHLIVFRYDPRHCADFAEGGRNLSLAAAGAAGVRVPVTARPTIVFFVFAFAVLLGDALDGRPLLVDNDDLIRFLQIRDLVQDNALFDLRLPFISMPEAYVSHY